MEFHMTNEELKKMNVKQVADLFLSNHCGRCDTCELAKKYVEIGGVFITTCHLMYSVLREDRKREDAKNDRD